MSWYSDRYKHMLSAKGIKNTKTNITNETQQLLPKQLVSDWKPHKGGHLFHGTSKRFDIFGTDVVYLTDDIREAEGYGNEILYVYAYPGNSVDISNVLYSESEFDDYDEHINHIIPKMKKQGYRYMTFYHPSFISEKQQEQNAIISLYPEIDLKIERLVKQ